MHRLYQDECAKNIPPLKAVQEKVYRTIFCEQYNLSFFHPKKDQCTVCVKHRTLTGKAKEAFKDEHQKHLERKERAQIQKSNDKTRATEDLTFVSATFDLQSVLQIPSSAASLLYYSRKLCVYNLCIYEASPPNNAFCLSWSELDARRGSSEIGTCVFKWLEKLTPTVKEVSLFSDTCGGQNRNQNVAAMFMYAVQYLNIETITHNFLESGHSQMECDSMHAAIEAEKKWIDVFSMVDWVNIFRRARRKNPYNVTHLHYGDFYNFQVLAQCIIKNRNKDENGATVNWLLCKGFKYSKVEPGVIQYRYDYNEPFKRIFVFGRGRPSIPLKLTMAYETLLPVSVDKKKDLVKLCAKQIIPSELHPWFQNLPTSKNVRDLLSEPAVDDSGDDDDGV